MLLTTLLISFVIVALCAVGIAIGKIFTGKEKFKCKRCSLPEDEKQSCGVCGKKKKGPPKK